MQNRKKILFLPDAGPDNPFQYMLVDYLRKNGYSVNLGKKLVLFSVLNAVRKTKPDVIYFDWIHSFLIGEKKIFSYIKSFTFCLEILIIKYLLNIQIVHTIHNIHSHAKRSLKLEQFFYSWFLKHCTLVRVYSASTISKIEDRFKISIKKYVIAPDLPYTMYYTTYASKNDGVSYLKLQEKNKFTYLFVGNVKPYKGVEELLEVFSNPIFNNDLLIIAGRVQKGEFEEKIKKKVKGLPNVLLLNQFIKEEELPYYFSVSDICVFPFNNIEHSGSVELAMSFKKAIITCNTPVIAPLLKNQSTLLFKNQDELADKMILSKSLDLSSIGLENHKTIQSTDYSSILDLFKV